MVRTATGQLVPDHFVALVNHPDLDTSVVMHIAVDEGTNAVCFSLGGARHDIEGPRPWVHEIITNLPVWGLRGWVRWAVAIMAREVETGTNALTWPPLPADLADAPDRVQHWSAVADTFAVQRTQRRKATTLDRLREVAVHYTAALAAQRTDPTQAVADALHLSRSGAAKLVGQCRKTTPPLLPPYERKRKDNS